MVDAPKETKAQRSERLKREKNPSAVRIDDHNAAIPVAEGLNRRLADDRIFAGWIVSQRWVAKRADPPRAPVPPSPNAGASDGTGLAFHPGRRGGVN